MPDTRALNLESVRVAAFEWQQHRSHARWHEMVWLAEDAELSSWVPEIHGIFGSVAELILAAIEAEVEKVLLQDAATREPVDSPLWAGLMRGVRFFAEGQMNYLVTAGHAIANIVLRTMCLHLRFRTVVNHDSLRIKLDDLVPHSRSRTAWASLNAKTVNELIRTAEKLDVLELADLAKALRELESEGAWKTLNALRGEQYHRWRGESPGVAGVNLLSEDAFTRSSRGEPITFPDPSSEYVEGATVVAKVVDGTTKTLSEMGEWMPRFMKRWSAAFAALRGQML